MMRLWPLLVPITLLPGASCSPTGVDGGSPPALVFGRSGMGPGEFNYPRAAAWAPPVVLPDGAPALHAFYVVDKGGHLQAVQPDGTPILGWMMPEVDAGRPVGLGFAPDGRLYVANTHYHEVVVFTPGGEILTRFGSVGRGPGQFELPTDVVATAEHVFVAEYGGNDRISRFTPDHTYEFSFGGPGASGASAGEAGGDDPGLRRPQGIALGPDGRIWAADACNHRVVAFSQEGVRERSFGERGVAPGQFYFPYSIDFLPDGTLVVCEYGNNRVQRFDRDGKFLGSWGRAGRRQGELAYPWAATVGPDGRVYVIDSGNNRVQVIAASQFTGGER